jgi:hypothetical protein
MKVLPAIKSADAFGPYWAVPVIVDNEVHHIPVHSREAARNLTRSLKAGEPEALAMIDDGTLVS